MSEYIQEFVRELPNLLIRIITILLALSMHEAAHGYAAYKCGDPTARSLGRLSLNPLRHLDVIGTLCMIFFNFGWAKPVPVNTRYFKKPRRDMALTALAGPIANVLLSFGGVLVYQILLTVFYSNIDAFDTQFKYNLIVLVIQFFGTFSVLNLYLALFNLIPVPPLDGSRVLFVMLPDKYYFGIMQYERYIKLVLMLLLYKGVLSGPLSTLCDFLWNKMGELVSLLPFIG